MFNKFLFHHHLVHIIINIITIHRIIYVIIQVKHFYIQNKKKKQQPNFLVCALVNFLLLALGRRNILSLMRLFSPKQSRGTIAGLQKLQPLPRKLLRPVCNSTTAVGGAEGTRLPLAQGPAAPGDWLSPRLLGARPSEGSAAAIFGWRCRGLTGPGPAKQRRRHGLPSVKPQGLLLTPSCPSRAWARFPREFSP